MNYRHVFAAKTGGKIKVAGSKFQLTEASESVDDDGIPTHFKSDDSRIWSTANIGKAIQEGKITMDEKLNVELLPGTEVWTNDDGITNVVFNKKGGPSWNK